MPYRPFTLDDPEFRDLLEPEPASFGAGIMDAIKEYATPSTALRIGLPIAGGIAGSMLGPAGTVGGIKAGLMAAGGAAIGGALGEAGAEALEGQPLDAGEIALAGGLSALPAGPAARAIRPGMGLAARAGLHALEGAGQGAVDVLGTSLYRTGELPSGEELAAGGAFGGVLGTGLGLGMERAFRPNAGQPRTIEEAIARQEPSQMAQADELGLPYTRIPEIDPAAVDADFGPAVLSEPPMILPPEPVYEPPVSRTRTRVAERPASNFDPGAPISRLDDPQAVPPGEQLAKAPEAPQEPILGEGLAKEPRYAFRARDVGEQGIPGVGHSQASLSEADVRRIAPSRTEAPQEVVKVDLARLIEGEDYVIHERPGADPWVQFKRPIPEEMVEKGGEVTALDREAASKAAPPLRQAVAQAPLDVLAQKTGLAPEAVEKGRADVDADGTRELSPEAVAVKRAVLEQGPLTASIGERLSTALGQSEKVDEPRRFTLPQIELEMRDVAKALETPITSAERRMQYTSRKPEMGLEGMPQSPKELAKAIRSRRGPVYMEALRRYWDFREGHRTAQNGVVEKGGGPSDAIERSAIQEEAGDVSFDPAKYAVRPSPGQRGLEGIAEDVAPKEPTKLVPPAQSDMFGKGALMQGVAPRTTEGRESEGPIFTQERDAAVKEDKGRQGSLATQREPWEMTSREWDEAFSKTRVNYSGTGGEQFGLGRRTSEKGHGSAIAANRAEQDRLKMGLPDRDLGDGLKAPARHYQVVQEAVRRNLPVPAEVLAEYPALKRKPPTPPAEAPVTDGAITSEKAEGVGEGQDTPGVKFGTKPNAEPESRTFLREVKKNWSQIPGARLVGDALVFTSPTGKPIHVRPSGEIRFTKSELRQGHGEKTARAVEAGESVVVGRTYETSQRIVAEALDTGTIDHEIGHVLKDHFASPKENHAIDTDAELRAKAKESGRSVDEEWADWLGEYVKARRAGQNIPAKSVLHRVAARIYDFLQRIFDTFNPSKESVARGAVSGRIFERGKGTEQPAATKFATAPAEPPKQPESKIRPIPNPPVPGATPDARAKVAEAGKAEGGRTSGKPPKEYINLNRIGVEDDVKRMESRVADSLKDQMGEARSYRSWTEARDKAIEAGLSESDFKRLVKQKGALSDHEIEAGRILREEAFKDSREKLEKLQALKKGDKEFADAEREYESAINRAAGVLWSTVRAGAEAGRSLAIHKKMSEGLTPHERLYRSIAKGRPGLSEEFTKRFLRTDPADSRALLNLVRAEFKPSLRSMAYEFWINGLLSGPPTHLANFSGNTLTALLKIPERVMAGALDKARSSVTGAPRERFVGEAYADVMAVKDGLKKAIHAFKADWADELHGLKTGSTTKAEQHVPKIPGKAGEVVRTPTRLLSASDEAFKALAATRESRALAYRKARMEGKKGQALANRIESILSDLESHPDILKGMQEAAEYQTFTKHLGKFGQMAVASRDADPTGAAKVIAPFMRTPINIAKYTLERTPLNFIRLADQIRKGQLEGGRIPEEFAKPVLGTLIGMGFAMMAQEGLLTGGGPSDQRANQALRATGWQPYSIHVGDQYISIQRFEPFSSIAGFAADMVEAKNEKTEGDLVNKIVGSVAENLTNKTFLQGVENAFLMWSDPKRYASQWAKSLEGSVVPAIVGRAAQAVDPVVRETKATDASAVLARIPFASKTLEPKPGPGGEPIERSGTALERFASPANRSTEKGSEKDLERQFVDVDFVPSQPAKSLTIPGTKGKKLELTDAEYKVFLDFDKRVTARLRRIVQDSRFQRMSPEARRNYLERAYSQAASAARTRVLPSAVRRFRQEQAN